MKKRVLTPLILAAVAFVSACNTPNVPTPAGASILKTTFTNAQGGPPAEHAALAPARHVTPVKVAGGAADVEVRLDVVDAPGGKYLHGVELVVTNAGGGTLTAEVPQGMMPVNRGTTEAVLASLTLMVTWNQTTATKTSLRQTSIEIAGDGTVTAR